MRGAYALPAHVWSCMDAGAIIFLDLKRDRYVGARASDAAGLVGKVAGLPRELEHAQGSDVSRTAAALARLLQEKLVEPATGDASPRLPLAPPERSAMPEASSMGGWKNALAFAAACSFAGSMLKLRRLDLAMERLAARKQRTPARPSGDAQTGAAAFLAWRPWFPARRVCLFDSIALMHFLTGKGQRADLVIGARAGPFGAHCWVEQDGAVLNDRLENCRWYVPIFKV